MIPVFWERMKMNTKRDTRASFRRNLWVWLHECCLGREMLIQGFFNGDRKVFRGYWEVVVSRGMYLNFDLFLVFSPVTIPPPKRKILEDPLSLAPWSCHFWKNEHFLDIPHISACFHVFAYIFLYISLHISAYFIGYGTYEILYCNAFGGRPAFPFGTGSHLRNCVRVRVTLPLPPPEMGLRKILRSDIYPL